MTMLDESRVRALLAELGGRLVGRGIEAEIYVVGGTAMLPTAGHPRYRRGRCSSGGDRCGGCGHGR